MDEQKRKKISILGSIAFHIFLFLFIALTGLLKFTTLPLHDDIVEITSVNTGSAGNNGGSSSKTLSDFTENALKNTDPIAETTITSDSLLQHSDTASTNITYEQIQHLQKTDTSSKNINQSNMNNTSSKIGNNESKTISLENGDGNGDNNGSGNSSGFGNGDNNGSGNGFGSSNTDTIYNSPAIPPRVIKSPKPKYPTNERNNKIEGISSIRLLIGKNGNVESAEIAGSSGSSALDQAALETAYKWKFIPAKNSNGENIRCYAIQPFAFKINK